MTRERTAFIVYDRDHALAVATVSAEMGTPVRLYSPSHGAAALGADVFQAIVSEARDAFPEADLSAVLDCGDEPGTALGAIRHGIEAISLAAEPDVRHRVADIAAQSGTKIVGRATEALDMSGSTDPAGDIRTWISKMGALD